MATELTPEELQDIDDFINKGPKPDYAGMYDYIHKNFATRVARIGCISFA